MTYELDISKMNVRKWIVCSHTKKEKEGDTVLHYTTESLIRKTMEDEVENLLSNHKEKKGIKIEIGK